MTDEPLHIARLSGAATSDDGATVRFRIEAADGRAVDLDLAVIGRGDRHAARERSNRMLPCGLLDTVGEDLATPRRLTLAQRLGVKWIDATAERWTSDVSRWLGKVSRDTQLTHFDCDFDFFNFI